MDDALPEGRLSGPVELEAMIRSAVRAAAVRGWAELLICDDDFTGWPLGEGQVVADLTRWALAGGRLNMLARDYRPVIQRAARFVDWRRRFDHRVEARTLPRTGADDLRACIWSPDWAVLKVDRSGCAWVASTDAAVRAQLRQEWNSVWPMATPGFAASTLGL